MLNRVLEAFGRAALRLLEELGRFFTMLGRVLLWAPRPPYDVPDWLRQMVRWGDEDAKYLAGSVPIH